MLLNDSGWLGPIGLHWIIRHLNLRVPPPAVRSEIISGSRRTIIDAGEVVEQYPVTGGYGAIDLLGHMRFALRYEPLDAGVWHAAMHAVDPQQLQQWARDEPTSRYTRRAWYLYEALTGRTLDLENAPLVRAVDLVDERLQFAGPDKIARRQRVNVNWLGDAGYSVLIRRTPRLAQSMAENLAARARQLVEGCDPALLSRAVHYLFTKETKSSFAIEGEAPSSSRAERFVATLAEAGRFDPSDPQAFVRLQNTIVDKRYAENGWRQFQNYVSRTRSDYTEDVRYACPKPEDVADLMRGWTNLTTQLDGSGIDPVCAAAAAAFGFVFIHPFGDGNGRIHRFLIHHVLARRGFTPPGLLFPVSAAMVRDRRAYDAVLERFSASVLPLVEWTIEAGGRMEVANPTRDLYRFWDATACAEYLYAAVAEAITRDLAEEIQFLQMFDRAVQRTMDIVDMPDRRASLLVRLIVQNQGALAKGRRGDFAEITDDELASIEAAVRDSGAP